ncbi:hypothetical protein P3X46_032610 [Hevea brasiliensis]|uniref:Uncharacterized protein n=1 Tax=Hevea brasiliensis TaxID=3981 RepID=A0ABQ9KGX2_HEVBR|nr:myb-related protein 315-like [Hevea brasiliensis]KAJ9135424.1 hypothetical protein P3X46_032610 [Hevea brasiliensis]
MGRQPCCDKIGLKRGPWTIEEDQKLMNFILHNGIHCWRMVPKLAGLLRCGKSCRLRWINYLRPDLKRGGFTEMEENQIIQLHSRLGNRWSKIASHFPGRTDNEIKNHWNTRIKKRLKQLGVDLVTHKPIEQTEMSTSGVNNITIAEEREESMEIKSQDDQAKSDLIKTDDKKRGGKDDDEELVSMDETSDLLSNNYEMLCGTMDLGSWIKQLENNNTSSYSFSLPVDEYNNPSIGESPSLQDMDSILSWDSFNNHLVDDIFFMENSQYCNIPADSVPKYC